MNKKQINKTEEDIAVSLINSFACLVHARLRGLFSKAVMYECELKELGVNVTFSNGNGGDHE
ncbi:MAG: hypothetical protein ABIK07_14985 [Planctomycetota bacterium]